MRLAGFMAATTIGAGMFSLPYITQRAGWLIGLGYLILATAVIALAHYLYFRTLELKGEKRRLISLAEEYFGNAGRYFGLVVVVGGLILALVIYLILASDFWQTLFPNVFNNRWLGTAIFWSVASLPIVFSRRLITSELVAAVFMTAIIVLVFAGFRGGVSLPVAANNWKDIFLPFGPILFALAGWTAVEPIFEYSRRRGIRSATAMNWGTIFTAGLYILFVLGILGSAAQITPEGVGGLTNWPRWKFKSLLLLGLFAIWTSYVPIGLEIKNALAKDLRWSKPLTTAMVLFLPPLLVAFGLRDFIRAVGLAGGVFLGLEYLLILAVGWKALGLQGGRATGILLLSMVFFLGAVYEVYRFVVD